MTNDEVPLEQASHGTQDYSTFDPPAPAQETTLGETVTFDPELPVKLPLNPAKELPSPVLQVAHPQSNFVKLIPTLLIIASCVFFSGMHACVRYTTTTYDISPLFIGSFRGILQTILAIGLIISHGRESFAILNLDRRYTFMVWFRGFLGALSVVTKYSSLSLIPVAVASSLFSISPICAIIFGCIFLREKLSQIDWIATILTSVAAVLVGTAEVNIAEGVSIRLSHIVGVILAITGAAATGITIVFQRAMGTDVHVLLSVLTLGISISILPFLVLIAEVGSFTGAVSYFVDRLLNAETGAKFGLLGVGFFAFAAAICLNRGAQLQAAGRSGLLRTFDIPINFLVGYLFLGELPHSAGELTGCALIAISTGLLAMKTVS